MRKVFIRVRNIKQYNAVVSEGLADAIILNYTCKRPENTEFKGELYLALPDILKESKTGEEEKIAKEAESYTGVVIKNIDELGLMKGYKGKVIADSFLYTYNSFAADFYNEIFPGIMYLAPDELTDDEISKLNIHKDRLIYKIYGHQQLMITNQCMNKNYAYCLKPKMEFEDNKHRRFIAASECGRCYTTIYNGRPTSVIGRMPEGNIFLDFTVEDEDEVTRVLKHFKAGQPIEGAEYGHHFKGID